MRKQVSFQLQEMKLPNGRKAIVSIPSNFRDSVLDRDEPDKEELASLYKRSAWAKRCVAIRANTLSSIPWEILQPSEEPVVEDHPLMRLLLEFNPEANWIDAIRACESDLEIYGEAFWLKLGENALGALMRLNPLTMTVDKDSRGISGFVQKRGAKDEKFEREEVVYFHDYNPTDDLGGLSDTHVAQTYIEAEINTENYVSSFFENYALPAVVFEAGEGMQKEEAEGFLRDFRQKFLGARKQHKAGVVPGKPHILTPDLEKLAMSEVRQEAIRSICTCYGVHPTMVGGQDAANWKIDELRQSLYTETILPRAAYIAGVLNAELLAMFPGNLQFRWKIEEIQALQPDRNAESERIRGEIEQGIINIEAAGRELGYPEEDLGEGPGERQPSPFLSANGHETNFGMHLGRWKAKAMRMLERTGNAQIEYETPAISDAMRGAVYAALGSASNQGDVDRVFERASMWQGYP